MSSRILTFISLNTLRVHWLTADFQKIKICKDGENDGGHD
jgi:hypothetical protein